MFEFVGKYLFTQKFFLNFIILFILFWLISIFIFIFKRSKFKFVTVDQRFWKRSLGLFWLLEIFLFGIYIYLWVFSPAEYTQGFDNFFVYTKSIFLYEVFFKKYFWIILVILASLFIFNNKIFNLVYFFSGLSLVCVLLMVFLIEDTYQLFYLLSFYIFENVYYLEDASLWEFEISKVRLRTSFHYILVIGILKFWHILFIYLLSLFIMSFTVFFKELSFDAISVILLSILFLVFFYFIFYLNMVKNFIKFFLTYPFTYLFCSRF